MQNAFSVLRVVKINFWPAITKHSFAGKQALDAYIKAVNKYLNSFKANKRYVDMTQKSSNYFLIWAPKQAFMLIIQE